MKKSLSIFVIIFLFIAVLRLVGLTYGYYSTTIIKNTNTNSLSVTSKYLKVEYQDGTSIMNFKGDYLFPGDSAEKLWTVKNSGTEDATYNVLIDNVNNEFERIQDLRYVLYINNEKVSSGAVNHHLKQYLYTNKKISAGEFDLLRLVFEYAETEEIQNIDMNKTISFRVNIDSNIVSSLEGTDSLIFVANGSVLNNYKIYGNSLQNGVPSIDSPVDILSVGELVADESSDYYGKYVVSVKLYGKNLFNAKAIKSSSIQVSDNGQTITMPIATSAIGQTQTLSTLAELCPNLKVGDQVILNFNSNTLYNKMIYLEDIKEFWYVNNIKTITQEMLDSYVSLFGNRFIDGETEQIIITDFQIEKATTATEFELYVEPVIKNVYLNEPLRKVGNVADYIDFGKQMVVRNIKELVLNGEESWSLQSINSYGIANFSTNVVGKINSSTIISDKLLTQKSYIADTETEGVFYSDESAFYIRINSSRTSSVLEFKEWLHDNPIKINVIMPASDTSELLNIPSLEFNDKTNNITTNNIVNASGIYIDFFD